MDTPKLTSGHQRLEIMAGDWVGEERMHPSQWDPKGGTAMGRTSSRIALNGFALISDYQQEREGKVTFAGHGVYTFDPKQDLYTLHWFDCLGSPPEVFQGRFEGNVLTLAHGGPGMHARLVYDYGEAAKLKSRMDMSMDGSAWKTFFDAVYVRRVS